MKGMVTVVGGEELSRKLRSLKVATGMLVANALMTGVLPMNDRWVENIYNYPLVETGTYARSVHVELVSQSATGAEVMVGTSIVDPPYPYFLEFGTWAISPKGVARAAFDATRDEVVRQTQRAFSYLLERYT